MTRSLLIIGAGGHGKVVADAALHQAEWDHIAFVDDASELPERVLGLPVIRDSRRVPGLRGEFTDLVVAVGDSSKRLTLIETMSNHGFHIPVIKHPTAAISPDTSVGPGTVMLANSAVNSDARLGAGCIINTCASVDHDCTLADGVHVSPGAHLAGEVRVGRESWIGIGACVRELVVIGDRVTVGAGSAVISDIADNMTVAGVPATPISTSRR